MKIRKGRNKYAIVIDRRAYRIYLTRQNSDFYFESMNRCVSWTCNFKEAKEDIKRGVDNGFIFSVIK
jgi:hypothetical protein